MVGAMFAVIGNKRTADVFPDFIRRIFRTGAFNEFYNSVSYKTAYFVNCALRKSVLVKRIIRCIGKILKRIKDSAVHIKNNKFVFHYFPVTNPAMAIIHPATII